LLIINVGCNLHSTGEDIILDFWIHHSWLFLFGLAAFPRITLFLFANISGLGILYWLGWLFAPHFTVAVLATTWYWETNPILVIIAWFIAFGGESAEKKGIHWTSKKKNIHVQIR